MADFKAVAFLSSHPMQSCAHSSQKFCYAYWDTEILNTFHYPLINISFVSLLNRREVVKKIDP